MAIDWTTDTLRRGKPYQCGQAHQIAPLQSRLSITTAALLVERAKLRAKKAPTIAEKEDIIGLSAKWHRIRQQMTPEEVEATRSLVTMDATERDTLLKSATILPSPRRGGEMSASRSSSPKKVGTKIPLPTPSATPSSSSNEEEAELMEDDPIPRRKIHLELEHMKADKELLERQLQEAQLRDPLLPIPDHILRAGGEPLIQAYREKEAAWRRTSSQGVSGATDVHTVPVVDWSALPLLNFAHLPSILPWFREFERATNVSTCSAKQKLAFVRQFPHSNGAAESTANARLTGEEATYEQVRNRLIKKLAHPGVMVTLLIDLQKKRPGIKTTDEWREAIRQTHKECMMVLEAYDRRSESEENRTETTLAYHAIEPYAHAKQVMLLSKMRNRADKKGIMEFVLEQLPEKFLRDPLDSIHVASAVYRPSGRDRYPMRDQGTGGAKRRYPSGPRGPNRQQSRPYAPYPPQPQRQQQDPKRFAGARPTFNKQDPKGKCRKCGSPTCKRDASCAAVGKVCAKCQGLNHFAAQCRSGPGKSEQTTKTD